MRQPAMSLRVSLAATQGCCRRSGDSETEQPNRIPCPFSLAKLKIAKEFQQLPQRPPSRMAAGT